MIPRTRLKTEGLSSPDLSSKSVKVFAALSLHHVKNSLQPIYSDGHLGNVLCFVVLLVMCVISEVHS